MDWTPTRPGNLARVRQSVSEALGSVCFRHITLLTRLTMDYYMETIALIFRGVTNDRDHNSDIVCYKAMDRLEWEACVDQVDRLVEEFEQRRDAVRKQYEAEKKTARQAGRSISRRPRFERLPCIFFDYDCGEHDMELSLVLKWTTVKSDPQLVHALEIISPCHLGSDIDVFDALKRALASKKDVGGILPKGRLNPSLEDSEQEDEDRGKSPKRWDRCWINHPDFEDNKSEVSHSSRSSSN